MRLQRQNGNGPIFIEAGSGTRISQESFREQIKAVSDTFELKGLRRGDVVVAIGTNTVRVWTAGRVGNEQRS